MAMPSPPYLPVPQSNAQTVAMGGSKKKATKKFEKKHLKDTIDRRKEFAKVKQRHQTKAKKKARNVTENGSAQEDDKRQSSNSAAGDSVNDLSKLSVDEFFQGGIDLPEAQPATKNEKKRKRAQEEVGSASSSDEQALAGDDDMSSLDNDEDDDGAQTNGIDSHNEDLNALAKNDPEFYKYLEENDAELLDFGNDRDALALDLEDLSEEEQPRKKIRTDEGGLDDGEEINGADRTELTMATIDKWRLAMTDQHSLRAMRETVLAFKTAAYINSDELQNPRYSIPNADIYHTILVTALDHVPKVLTHHIPPKKSAPGKVRISTDSKKFRSLVPTLKSYATSIHHLLETLSDSPTIKLTLNALQPLLPYILSFSKFLRQLLATVIAIWASPISKASEAESRTEAETTLITAFLVIRRIFTLSDNPSLRTTVLKQIYLNIVKTARTTNSHTLPTINLLKNSSAELWSLDPRVGYTTAFSHIRQLAIHLRTTITKPSKESHRQIYNWQYIHGLDFWARVLCHSCSLPTINKPADSPLHPLIYPLVQISLGTLRLIPSPTYFPLHLHIIRTLLRVSLLTNTYIPLAPPLLSMLQSFEMSSPPSKASTLPPLNFSTVLRAPKPYLRTRTYQDGMAGQIQLLLAEFFTFWAKNIAFPELVVPPTVMLKRWLKSLTRKAPLLPPSTSGTETQQPQASNRKARKSDRKNTNPRIHALFTSLLQKIAQQAAYVKERRSKVTFAPSQRDEVEMFLRDVKLEDTPLGAWVEGARERERDMEAQINGRGDGHEDNDGDE